MELAAIIVLILFVANVIWGLQGGFKAGTWPFWVNFLGSLVLALITFTSIL